MLARAKALRETSRELVARALEVKRETDGLHLHLRRVSDMNSAPFIELRKSVEDYAAAKDKRADALRASLKTSKKKKPRSPVRR